MTMVLPSQKSQTDPDCVPVSLEHVANRSYTDVPGCRGWTGDAHYYSIAGIPDGIRNYGGFPFLITNAAVPGSKDFLRLAASCRAPDSEDAVLPVNVSRPVRQLALLHAAAWAVPGETLGVIECRFADGHRQTFDVIVGRDVSDWYDGSEGENVRYAYAEGAYEICGNFLSVFNLDSGCPAELSFHLSAPDGIWLISAVTLLENPRPLPEKEIIRPVLVPGIPPETGASADGGSSCRIIVLGDTHFDADPEIYHTHYNEPDLRLNAIQRAEFARNAAMWRERCPRLVAAAASHITQDTPFIIQAGDLIQGDCGDAGVHRQMLTDTFRYFKRSFHDRPFLTAAGNHDVRGAGAFAAYRETMPQLLSREMQMNFSGTTFYFMRKEDLFLFVDFNAPDLGVIREAFEKHPDARYKFVVSHGAVIPADEETVNWYAFGDMRRIRPRMLDLFLRNRVIVLTGHVHKLGLAELKTADGEITQLTLNSVWSDEWLSVPKVLFDSPADYGRLQRERFRNPEGAALLSEYRPALTRYWYAEGAGYCVLDISPAGVTARLFGGDSEIPVQIFSLR